MPLLHIYQSLDVLNFHENAFIKDDTINLNPQKTIYYFKTDISRTNHLQSQTFSMMIYNYLKFPRDQISKTLSQQCIICIAQKPCISASLFGLISVHSVIQHVTFLDIVNYSPLVLSFFCMLLS